MFKKSILLVLTVVCLITAEQGWASVRSPISRDSVTAPVVIQNQGLYNLVIGIQFLDAPSGAMVYHSEEYEDLMQRLKVEWAGLASGMVLQSKEHSISDLAALKNKMEKAIQALAENLKPQYGLDANVDVVFSLTDFFLLDPHEED
ncbi:hypothetical protein [Desulfogranum japonicum]|uniref:hypothetical protein n=1 Tax=Desulfogranum japonicum TaxID=231447 RepID=UPI0003FD3E79|nr:hypothetical protein [Desulfogranum japonicum]